MNTRVERKYQDWDKGILRFTLQVGTINKLRWFWDYVIRRKPLFVEIQFYGKTVKYVDEEEGEVYYTSSIGGFMADMDEFKVVFLNSKQIDATRTVTDGDK